MSKDELKVVTVKMELKHFEEMQVYAERYGIDVSALIRLATLSFIRQDKLGK